MKNMVGPIVKMLVMAFLFSAAVTSLAGDIISIDVLEDSPYSVRNGGKTYPNSGSPHSIGETISIRIRLVNNDLGMRGVAYPWKFIGDDTSPAAVKLGLSVGGVPRYATMVSCLPTRATGRGSEDCFTDLVFEYEVRPGDLAQPLKLLNREMNEAVEGDEYLIVLPSANSGFYNAVDSSDSSDVQRPAVFSFCGETVRTQAIGHYPPADASADERGTPTEDYTLAGAGVYIKTIDFDADYVDTAADPYVWRTIAQGSSKSKKNGNPSIVVDAAADFDGSGSATMYVWSENDDIITPVGAQPVDGSSRKALPITISTGDTQKSFILKATGTEGQGAWIYMSSAPTNMYGTAGELITKTVSRYVMVGEPEKPSVSVTFRSNSWAEATAGSGYMETDYPVEMAITLSETFEEDVTVTLTPVLDNDSTNIDVYANHVIATAPSAGLGNGWQLATNSVTFARNEDVEKFLYVYPLGATKGSARNGGTGIEFRITVEPAAASAHFVTKTPGVLYVNPAAPNVLDPVSGQAYEFTAGKARDIAIAVDDSCRNMRYLDGSDEAVYAGTNYYSVVWERNDDTSTSTMEWKGLVPDSDGNLTLDGVRYPNSGTYLKSQIMVTGPEGRKTVIPVSALVSLPRTVTATPDRADLTYSEGDTVRLTIGLSRRDGEDMYAFVQPLNEAATKCLSGAQLIGANGKATGAGVLVPGTGTVGFKTLDFTLLDGYCEPKFQVVLCSEETYDRSKIVDRYTPVPVTIVCGNAAPQGKAGRSLWVGGYSVTNNAALPAAIPADNAVTLRIYIDDVAADRRLGITGNETLVDWINGAEPDEFTNGLFLVKWAFYDPNGLQIDTRITVGSSRAGYATTNFTFTAIGNNEVAVQMLDKDMIQALLDSGIERSEIVSWEGGVPYGDPNGCWKSPLAAEDWGPEYRVTVPVVSGEVELTVSDSYKETDLETIQVGLNSFLGYPLVVKLTVAPPDRTNPGEFVLDSTYKTVPTGYPALGDNEYYVSLKYGGTASVGIASMDGTVASSMYGFTVKAEVVTPEWSDVYIPATRCVYVQNVAPTIGSVTPENPNAWMVAGGVASMPIIWQNLSDVEADLAAGITVRFEGCENTFTTNVTEATSGSFVPDFGSRSGSQSVTMTIEDKDGASQTWTYLYYVQMPPEYIVADGVLTGAVLNDATKVEIPQGVVRIGESVFADCSSLTSVVIPDSVTNIADNAFRNCILLTSVVMEGDCPEVGVDAFCGVDPSCVVRLPANNSTYTVTDGKWQGMNVYGLPILTIVDGVLSEVNLNGATNVVIPSCVTSIGDYAFGWCFRLESVTIPDSVKSIGDEAFDGCSGLTSITIPNSVTNIGYGTFERCSGLTNVTISSTVMSIADSTFSGCESLTSVTIPDGVTSIGDYAFEFCGGLANVTIPDSVTSIGECAFQGCEDLLDTMTIPGVGLVDGWVVGMVERPSGHLDLTGIRGIGPYAFMSCHRLESVTIGKGVTRIAEHAFVYCDNLTEVELPDSVTSIGAYAFECCGLTRVTIPDSVTNIGDYAFSCCRSLTNVIFNGNAPEVGDSAFDDNPDLTFYVRRGSTGWGVDIPGTWQGMRIEYLDVVAVNGAAVEFETAADGKTRTATVTAGTTAEDVKVFVGGVDVTAGFKVAVEGTTATVVLREPFEAADATSEPQQAWTDNGDGNVTLNVDVVPGLYYAADSAATIDALKRPGAAEPAKAGDAIVAPKQEGAQGFYKVWVSDAPIEAE